MDVYQLKLKLKMLLKDVWPTIYRILNSSLFFTIKLVKTIIVDGIKQLKGQL